MAFEAPSDAAPAHDEYPWNPHGQGFVLFGCAGSGRVTVAKKPESFTSQTQFQTRGPVHWRGVCLRGHDEGLGRRVGCRPCDEPWAITS